MPKNVKVKNVKENIGLFMIQIIQQKKSKIYLFWKISLSAWHSVEIRYDRYSIDLFEEMRTKINICRRRTDRFSGSFQANLKLLSFHPSSVCFASSAEVGRHSQSDLHVDAVPDMYGHLTRDMEGRSLSPLSKAKLAKPLR